MGARGPLPQVIPGTEERRVVPVLIHVYRDEWQAFQAKHGKGKISRRIRELVREDVERG